MLKNLVMLTIKRTECAGVSCNVCEEKCVLRCIFFVSLLNVHGEGHGELRDVYGLYVLAYNLSSVFSWSIRFALSCQGT